MVAGALVAFPIWLAARQQAVPPKVAQTTPSQSPTTVELDNKLLDILTSKARESTPDEVIRALERFIRDYPEYSRLSQVYSELMLRATGGGGADPDTLLALADEGVTKFPNDVNLRRNTMVAKIKVLQAQKKGEAAKALAEKLLTTETEPLVLRDVGWAAGPEHGFRFMEKAIAERRKHPDGTPSLGDLAWNRAQMTFRWGGKDDGIALAHEAVDRATEEITDLEAMTVADPASTRITSQRRALSSRCQDMAALFANQADYQKALECVALAERAEGAVTSGRYAALRAGIYAKIGNTDQQMEALAKSFAADMNVTTRAAIVDIAAKTGRKPEDIFERAREIRTANAEVMKPFALKDENGKTIALESLHAKAVLVDFFFPT